MFEKYVSTIVALLTARYGQFAEMPTTIIREALTALADLIELDKTEGQAGEILFDATRIASQTPYIVRAVSPQDSGEGVKNHFFTNYDSARYFATSQGLDIVNDCGNRDEPRSHLITNAELSDMTAVRSAEEETLRDVTVHLVETLRACRLAKAVSARGSVPVGVQDDLWRAVDEVQGHAERALDRIDPEELSEFLTTTW